MDHVLPQSQDVMVVGQGGVGIGTSLECVAGDLQTLGYQIEDEID